MTDQGVTPGKLALSACAIASYLQHKIENAVHLDAKNSSPTTPKRSPNNAKQFANNAKQFANNAKAVHQQSKKQFASNAYSSSLATLEEAVCSQQSPAKLLSNPYPVAWPDVPPLAIAKLRPSP